jgi:hypothetical protein
MSKKNIITKLVLISLLPIGLLISNIFSLYPEIIEKYYSNSFDKYLREGLSIFFGIFPFSVAELIAIIFIIIISYYIIYIIRNIKSHKNVSKIIIKFFLNTAATIGIIYITFLIVWGLNYDRLPFSTIAKLEIKPGTTIELTKLCQSLIYKSNKLRINIQENKNGTLSLIKGKAYTFRVASIGYSLYSDLYPELSGKYGKPKGVLLSKVMSYEGISGIYFPFTGEPNVNIDIPDSLVPCTVCHEMAHQHGFAREDEANFISYLVCIINPDISFQYSGTLLALINAMNSLYTYDPNKYKHLTASYSEGLKRDLIEIDKYWAAYEGPMERLSTSINNAYLKSNHQKNGVFSYGRMVDLLIAENRIKQKVKQ